MDAAATWDRVAVALAAEGHRVLAPDARGFGDGPRAPRGSYYHFADYVADLAAITSALSPDDPIALVGHSMGGTIATLFAGAFPERVHHFVNAEGLGPPDNPRDVGPTRMRRWIEQLRGAGARRDSMTREDAWARLTMAHAGVDPELLEDRFPHLVREVEAADGSTRLEWRFDPLHRTTSPSPFFASHLLEFAKRVACPVLFVSGGETGFHVPDEEARLAAFARLERVVLEGAGHMVHWTRPVELAAHLVRFFAR